MLGVFFFSFTSHAGVIKTGDILEISLKGVPPAEQAKVYSKLEVRDNGIIRIPMINVDVRVAGRLPNSVERSIEAEFKKAEIYSAPTISIQVHEKKDDEEVTQKVVIVGGEVGRSGRVQFRDGMTLMEALEQAGGRSTFASKYLYLTRMDHKSGKLLRHKLLYKDPKTKALKLKPDDLLNVPVRGAVIDRG